MPSISTTTSSWARMDSLISYLRDAAAIIGWYSAAPTTGRETSRDRRFQQVGTRSPAWSAVTRAARQRCPHRTLGRIPPAALHAAIPGNQLGIVGGREFPHHQCRTPGASLELQPLRLHVWIDVLAEVDGACFTSHVNENLAEVATVAGQFPHRDALRRHLRPPRPARAASVLAHNVHPTDAELGVLAARGAAVAHCPTQQRRPRLAGSSRCGATSRRASASRSAATSARAPGSRSSRRGCRPTSCSTCSAPTGCRSPRPPAAPQHRGGRGGPGPRRRGRRPVRGQAVRRDLRAPAGRHRARHRPAARGLAGGGAGQGLRARPATPTSPTCGSVATRSPPAGSLRPVSRARASSDVVRRQGEEVGELLAQGGLDEQPRAASSRRSADASPSASYSSATTPLDELAGHHLAGGRAWRRCGPTATPASGRSRRWRRPP